MPHARVLAESFCEHHAGGTFATLVVDYGAGPVTAAREPFELVRPSEIGLDARELYRMAALYNVSELSTALKPWFLRALLDRGLDHVVYFDPDIEIFAPLDDIATLSRDKSIVLTPHTTEPMPNDGRIPNERTILLAGIYNLGFIGVGTGSRDFLDWWAERLDRDCYLAPEEGATFVDQRWIDFGPALFEHHI